jgi:hypothetical protein
MELERTSNQPAGSWLGPRGSSLRKPRRLQGGLMFRKTKLLAVALGLLVVFGGAASADAADWHRDCDRKIAHEQRDLDRAIARHGYYSHQAERERRELDRLYAQCRYRYR